MFAARLTEGKQQQQKQKKHGSFAKVVTSSMHVFRVHLYSWQQNGNRFYNAEQGVMPVWTQQQAPLIENTDWTIYTPPQQIKINRCALDSHSYRLKPVAVY